MLCWRLTQQRHTNWYIDFNVSGFKDQSSMPLIYREKLASTCFQQCQQLSFRLKNDHNYKIGQFSIKSTTKKSDLVAVWYGFSLIRHSPKLILNLSVYKWSLLQLIYLCTFGNTMFFEKIKRINRYFAECCEI